jgi:uncharacterized protein DUF4331
LTVRKRIVAAAAAVSLGVGLFAGLGPTVSTASSHREAPLTSADPQIDNTDVYAFVSRDRPGMVNLISSWIPFEEPAGGPNFYLWAEQTNYDIRIDNDADAVADLIYRWRFTTHYRNRNSFIYNNGPVTSLRDSNLLIYQTYDLWRINLGHGSKRLLHNAPVVPSNVGDASMPGYAAKLFAAGVRGFGARHSNKSWVGQSDDPFFLDLRVFDLIYGGDFTEAGDDTLAGFNVNTMALQVPKAAVRGRHGPVIGVWSTASRGSVRIQNEKSGGINFKGDDVQVSRLGMPLVNEVVVPVGAKDYFNASKPGGDAQFLGKVRDPELPHLIHAVYPSVFPKVPDSHPGKPGVQRADLISVFLTGVAGVNKPAKVKPSEMLRLNLNINPCTSSCSKLGVIGGDLAGFPNGRRLSDDTIDIALRVVMGVLLPNHDADANNLGDGVNANDRAFLNAFPYVAYPWAGSAASPH